MKLKVDVLTPQSQIFSGEADEVLAPTVNGEIAILPNHVSLLTQILPGELQIKTVGKTHSIAILGGYLQVADNKVSILGDYAIRAEEIEVNKAEAAKTKAEKQMKEKVSQEDFATIEAELRRSLLELKVAHKNRNRRLQ